jgi:hypothetical protein
VLLLGSFLGMVSQSLNSNFVVVLLNFLISFATLRHLNRRFA